jgi:UDP-N-acetylmuramoylalanine--D-glutamate ligase
VSPTPIAPGTRVVVAGLARSGVAASQVLLDRGARVLALDSATTPAVADRAGEVERWGGRVGLGTEAASTLPDDTDLVIASPGWPPSAPLLVEAVRRGVPVWGEVELAWRLRPPGAASWLVVTGTNGKTTTTRMLEAVLRADGRRTAAVGNIGVPLVSVVTSGEPYDVLAVELGSPQLHSVRTVAAQAAVVLNLAVDHIDWHGSFAAYRAAKRVAYDRCVAVAVSNADDPQTAALVDEAELGPGCRRAAFTLGVPQQGQLGVVAGTLVDRTGPAEVALAPVDVVHPAAPHNTANALAAAALARAVGVAPTAVERGLTAFVPEPHRITEVATLDGVGYVDDSKATNAHAAQTSLAAYPRVVWVAGGLAKGQQFDDLVAAHASRLRGAVLLGQDRGRLAEALARHAPDIPVVDVAGPDTGDVSVMDAVVRAARALARPGDTVLLAPACASWDQFSDYTDRGSQFAHAVRRLAGAT